MDKCNFSNFNGGVVTPSMMSVDDKKRVYIGTDEDKVLTALMNLENVCASLAKSKGVIFHCEDKGQLTYCDSGKQLLAVLKNEVLYRVEQVYPESRLNPFLKIILDAIEAEDAVHHARRLDLYACGRKMDVIASLLNRLVEKIRQEINCKDFKSILRNYQRAAHENTKESFRLVDALFKKHAKVLVVRLDLLYKKVSSRPLDQQNIRHSDARRNLATLLKALRRESFGKSRLSHIWKLEYGPCRGYHYHIFFFFDGAKVMQDINLATMIGEYWNKEVTDGSGDYYNCNLHKGKYASLGIGMIGHQDLELIENLKHKAIKYLMKVDYLIKPIAGDRIRTFGRGAIPKLLTKPRGRPRRVLPVK